MVADPSLVDLMCVRTPAQKKFRRLQTLAIGAIVCGRAFDKSSSVEVAGLRTALGAKLTRAATRNRSGTVVEAFCLRPARRAGSEHYDCAIVGIEKICIAKD